MKERQRTTRDQLRQRKTVQLLQRVISSSLSPRKQLLKKKETLKKRIAIEAKLQELKVVDKTLSLQMCRACFGEYFSSAIHCCQNTQQVVPSDLVALAPIGKGSFGKVVLVQRKQTGEKFALKVMTKAPNKKKIIRSEKTALSALSHPLFVKLYSAFQGQQFAYLLMEHVTGVPLTNLIKEDPNGMEEAKAKKLFAKIILAVSVLHEKNFGHRDLKPENMLWDAETNTLKLIDFGYSCKTTNQFQEDEDDFGDDLQHDPTDRNILRYTAVGTPLYAPPELLLSSFQGYDSKKMDVWSLGIILWELMMGKVPFNAKALPEYRTLLRSYKAGIHKLPWEEESCRTSSMSEMAKNLIELMLKADYRERPSVKQVMNHPFFEGVDFDELLEEVLMKERTKNATKTSSEDNNAITCSTTTNETEPSESLFPSEVSELFIDQQFISVEHQRSSTSYYEDFDFFNLHLFRALNPEA